MRRTLLISAALLTACGGTSTLRLKLTSGDSTAGALRQPLATSEDLSAARSVKVTVSEISVHVAGEEEAASPDEADATAADREAGDDARGGWRVLSTEERTVDLVTLRDVAPEELGEFELPAGQLTQLRLALKAPESRDGFGVLPGAVTDASGRACDLIVPQSAVKPGIKVKGDVRLVAGAEHDVLVDLRLHESTREDTASGCAYRLNPVLQLSAAAP